jgi:hypothetical protein
MKKLLASILLLVYFTVNTGFVVSVHYCMDKVDSVKLGDTDSDECAKCGMHMEDSNGCCKDDVKMVKLQADQAFAKVTAPDFSLPVLSQTFNEFSFSAVISSVTENYPLAHGPPLSEQDTYLLNCVFRI